MPLLQLEVMGEYVEDGRILRIGKKVGTYGAPLNCLRLIPHSRRATSMSERMSCILRQETMTITCESCNQENILEEFWSHTKCVSCQKWILAPLSTGQRYVKTTCCEEKIDVCYEETVYKCYCDTWYFIKTTVVENICGHEVFIAESIFKKIGQLEDENKALKQQLTTKETSKVQKLSQKLEELEVSMERLQREIKEKDRKIRELSVSNLEFSKNQQEEASSECFLTCEGDSTYSRSASSCSIAFSTASMSEDKEEVTMEYDQLMQQLLALRSHCRLLTDVNKNILKKLEQKEREHEALRSHSRLLADINRNLLSKLNL